MVRKKSTTEDKLVTQSQPDWDSIFWILKDPAMIVSPDFRILHANRVTSKAFGLTEQELKSRPCYEIFHGTKAPPPGCPLAKVIASGIAETADMEVEMLHGSYRVSCTPILDENGKIQSIIHLATDITERKRTEDSLRESQELLSLFMRHSPIYAFIKEVTPDESRVLQASDNYQKMIGVSGHNMIGKSMFELFPPESAAKFTADDWAVVSNGQVLKLDEDFNGRHYTTIKFPIIQGDKILLAGYTIDITERKQAEEEIQKIAKHYQALIEKAPDGIVLLNEQGNFKFFSPSAKKMFGYDVSEELTGNPVEFTHPDDLPRVLPELARLLEDPSYVPTLQYRFIDKSGNWKWVESTFSNLLADPSVESIVINFRDITERKQAEEAVQESSERLAHMITNSPTAIYALKMKGDQAILTWISGNIEPILGFSEEEAMRPDWWLEQVHSQDRPQAIASLEHLYDDFYQHEYRFLRKDGSLVWLRDEHRLLRDAENKPLEIIGAWTDITEHKQVEEKINQLNAELEQRVEDRTLELRDAQEKLIRQEKLAVLGQMASSIGHELRNPLAVITSAVYYLKLVQADADAKIKEYLGIIDQEVRNSDKIITDLLDFARAKSVDREAVSVSDLIHQTLERFPAPANVEVTLEIPTDLPRAYVDVRQMIQVLGNLTVNACQAMKDGGQLTILSRVEKTVDEGQSTEDGKPSSVLSHPSIVISVKDTGVGIPPENMKKLFEPLFTTKTKGIGLGLAVSQKLTEANGGRIEVESEAGVGSTFTVWLPVK